MLRKKPPQSSFYGSYIYDRIIPQDHLSGTALVTNVDGSVNGTMSYYPFGGNRIDLDNVPTDILYTGQRLDDTGLYCYGARYYDATMGRFISLDTIVPDPANPQSFNRYSYCVNNPLKYVDPSGNDYYLALLQYYSNKPQVTDYVTGGDPVSQIYGYSWYDREYTAWQGELNTIQKAYGVGQDISTSEASSTEYAYAATGVLVFTSTSSLGSISAMVIAAAPYAIPVVVCVGHLFAVRRPKVVEGRFIGASE